MINMIQTPDNLSDHPRVYYYPLNPEKTILTQIKPPSKQEPVQQKNQEKLQQKLLQ